MREERWEHKGQQGWMSPAYRHRGGHRVPEKLPWEGTSLSEQDGTLWTEKIQLGVWKLENGEAGEGWSHQLSQGMNKVKEVGTRFNPTCSRQLSMLGGRSCLWRDGADAGGLPVPKGRFSDKSKEEGSTEGCKYREIRKSRLAQEIP